MGKIHRNDFGGDPFPIAGRGKRIVMKAGRGPDTRIPGREGPPEETPDLEEGQDYDLGGAG